MLKPEILKASPHPDYEMLKRQFFALKKLCESKIEQCAYYSRKLAEYDMETHLASLELLNSERDMNAQLTSDLEVAEKRIAELEKERDEILDNANETIIGGITDEKVNAWLSKRDIKQQIKGVTDYISTLDRNLDEKVYLKTVEKDARVYCEQLRQQAKGR